MNLLSPTPQPHHLIADYIQHASHFASIQPSVVIVKKIDYSPMHLSGASAGGGEAVAPGLEGHAPVDDPDNLIFDASFG